MRNLYGAQYDVLSDCVAHGDKDKSGDSVSIRRFDSEGILLLIVADGVGSHRCDWLASQTVCRGIAEAFNNSGKQIPSRLKESVLCAHSQVRNATGSAAGMLSTVVSVVWPIGENRIYYVSIGDSRIYRFSCRDEMLLSKDNVGRVVLRINQEIVLSAGVPVFAQGLTQAIGQADPLQFEIQESEFFEGESLALATDGMHGKGAFIPGINEALIHEDLQTRVSALVRQHSSLNRDDAALVLLRRNDVRADQIKNYENALMGMQDFRESSLFGHIMSRTLAKRLTCAVAEGDSSSVWDCLNYMQKFSICLPRDGMLALFDAVISAQRFDRKVIQTFRSIISRLQ